MTRKGTQVLDFLPQIEEPALNRTDEKVLACLKSRKDPLFPKGIANKLNINEHSVRGSLRKMKQLGLVYQPLKVIRMAELNTSGLIDFKLRERQSYSAKV